MKNAIVFFFLFLYIPPICAQDGFQFDANLEKVSIPFKFINNLIFIPIKVNGMELNFLLDSGVEETILFSLEDKQEVRFFNIEKISLRGLGGEDAIEGLKSANNVLTVNGMKSVNHLLYVVLDQDFNLSSHIGIPVNGIIGYQFFRNNLVEIDYEKKKVIVYKDNKKNRRKIEKRFNSVDITIERSKPYVMSNVQISKVSVASKLLIDTGNSDAIWLFENAAKGIIIPQKNFEDYLGRGFSGDVEGKRARIEKFTWSEYEFEEPIVAFPDSSSIRNVKLVPGRMGSVGGEILKRFAVIFDYTHEKMFLKKNSDFNDPFSYNKSGIEMQHHGLQWVQETVRLQTVPINGIAFDANGNKIANDFKYKFELKPVYEVASVRKNSPAANCGLQKGDVIVAINKIPTYNYSLEKINALLKSEEEKWIVLEVERAGKPLKFKFQLLNIL
jgi:hypothetical protein